jgi:hypothetical protein
LLAACAFASLLLLASSLLDPRSDRPRSDPRAESAVEANPALPNELLAQRLRRELRRQRAAHTRATLGDPRREQADGNARARLYPRQRGRARRLASRFFDAFARYELGERRDEVDRNVRSTSTRAFSHTLLARAPRVPDGGAQPPRARLARVEFVAGRTRSGTLATAEVVLDLIRDRSRSSLSLAVGRVHGRWQITGFGR